MVKPVIGRCPVCNETLEISRLHCHACDTTIEGHFSLGKFNLLSSEQLAFVETFVRCEGKINRVEEELGISYPTVRSRLNEVIRAMGYEVREEPPSPTPEQRRQVLEQLAQGEITTEEALRLLRARP